MESGGAWSIWVVSHLHEDANPARGCGDLREAVVNRAEDLPVLGFVRVLDAETHLLVLVAQCRDLATVFVAVLAVDL